MKAIRGLAVVLFVAAVVFSGCRKVTDIGPASGAGSSGGTVNTAPVWTSFSDEEISGTTVALGVDLWYHVEDDNTADENIVFALADPQPDVNAGVSLAEHEGRPIILIEPISGWSGITTITVSATDEEGLSSQASFNVTVVDPSVFTISATVEALDALGDPAEDVRSFGIQFSHPVEAFRIEIFKDGETDIYVSTTQTVDTDTLAWHISPGSWFDPKLESGTTYDYVVSAVRAEDDATAEASGTFTTTDFNAPAEPTLVSPADGATDVAVTQQLSWNTAEGATSYGVYFGTIPDQLTFQGQQTETTWDPGELEASTAYYWQIVATNGNGSTSGSIWSFMTIKVDPSSEAQGEVFYSTWGQDKYTLNFLASALPSGSILTVYIDYQDQGMLTLGGDYAQISLSIDDGYRNVAVSNESNQWMDFSSSYYYEKRKMRPLFYRGLVCKPGTKEVLGKPGRDGSVSVRCDSRLNGGDFEHRLYFYVSEAVATGSTVQLSGDLDATLSRVDGGKWYVTDVDDPKSDDPNDRTNWLNLGIYDGYKEFQVTITDSAGVSTSVAFTGDDYLAPDPGTESTYLRIQVQGRVVFPFKSGAYRIKDVSYKVSGAIIEGKSVEFWVMGEYWDGTMADVTVASQVISRSPDVVTVDEYGDHLLGVGEGSAILFTSKAAIGMAAEYVIEVESAILALNLSVTSLTLELGKTVQYSVRATRKSGITETVSGAIFTVGNSAVLSSALVALSEGTSTVKAAYNGLVTAEVLITVIVSTVGDDWVRISQGERTGTSDSYRYYLYLNSSKIDGDKTAPFIFGEFTGWEAVALTETYTDSSGVLWYKYTLNTAASSVRFTYGGNFAADSWASISDSDFYTVNPDGTLEIHFSGGTPSKP